MKKELIDLAKFQRRKTRMTEGVVQLSYKEKLNHLGPSNVEEKSCYRTKQWSIKAQGSMEIVDRYQ